MTLKGLLEKKYKFFTQNLPRRRTMTSFDSELFKNIAKCVYLYEKKMWKYDFMNFRPDN